MKRNKKPGRKPKPINTDDLRVARLLVARTHKVLHTWDAAALRYNVSKAAAHRIANDITYRPSQETINKILATAKPITAIASKPQKRKRYYRPCVDCAIGEVVKEMGIDVNYVLLKYLEERDALP